MFSTIKCNYRILQFLLKVFKKPIYVDAYNALQ